MGSLFSVPIFFVVFRETLEASIIISILLALANQLVGSNVASALDPKVIADAKVSESPPDSSGTEVAIGDDADAAKTLVKEGSDTSSQTAAAADAVLLRRLKFQIFAGAFTGLFIAFAIGAAFLAVFYLEVNDLWGAAEDLWEGIFSLVASFLIWVMGLTMLRMDRAKIKWRLKLRKAFAAKTGTEAGPGSKIKSSRSSKYALFLLPCITVLREGLEAVVFVGGVSLGQSASSIPIAAIVGAVCGLLIGFFIYKSSSRLNLSIFLVVSTALLLLLGAGLFSKAIGDFERYKYNSMVGADVAEAGDGPGSYSVHGNVWHLNCCNPENKTGSYGWAVFNAVLGWTHNATIGSILSYILYWLSVVFALVYMKWSEGRFVLFGYASPAWQRKQEMRAKKVVENGAGSSVETVGV
ncbi:iron permease FTR1 [Gonapodya prolifera JEL478]|uniref:Iron permease FTR1 n=1 Tax=Gonapodya prolifera (strain JEL478) TaxID=1344416 RepID=A0A139A8K4_GONPJ|nr:iron permease FTR1 [Gonapodya prolifera JEL478]|eukprot:KXS12723.1 iron permease FTR1 [Gonapodya prolifera JEL478]